MGVYNKGGPLEKYHKGENLRLDPSLRKLSEMESSTLGSVTGSEGHFAVIGKLESTVSKIQIVQKAIEKLMETLEEMRNFMEYKGIAMTKGIESSDVLKNFLKEQLAKIGSYVANSSFQGKGLLNGDCGVTGITTRQDLKFVKGSSRSISTGIPGYPVSIYQVASAASLVGHLPVNRETLRQETTIAIQEGKQQMRYRLKRDENPESLIHNLQDSLLNHGLDIKVTRTVDNKLCFVHNQLGSDVQFFGASGRTKIISDFPGELKKCQQGKDIVGTIGREQTSGTGGFLVGNRGNRNTDGLILYYDGKIKFPGEIIGYVKVMQNGLYVPLDLSENRMEVLSIPPLSPEHQSVGVSNGSAFGSLNAINVDTKEQSRDALKLILWAISDLKQLRQELQWKEDSYINRTIEFLKGSVRPLTAGEEIMDFSKVKACEMAGQLKSMLSSEVVA
ncbi:MAG: hypothetical protein GY786_00790 [Proteobacteria bacterium]|nr:hypothetical protein [Pseudomonadota bacterium]